MTRFPSSAVASPFLWAAASDGSGPLAWSDPANWIDVATGQRGVPEETDEVVFDVPE